MSRSIEVDRRLAFYDIRATLVHAQGLARAGLLSDSELNEIEGALSELKNLLEEGEFEANPEDEDIHSVVERFLTAKLGETGARIHAGRSRNDLVATDLRLWLKDAIKRIARGVHELEEALYRQARDHLETIAPGYTHLQRAQPVLLPHLLLAHTFALGRDFERMISAYRRTDVSPLGAAAFSGTSIPVDPEAAASALGFMKVFDNAADAVSDRDFALEFLSAAAILGVNLSRLGEEIVLWTSAEFGFAELDDAYSTGSSIMPQKKNPDVAELARARSSRLTAHLVHLLGVVKGLPLAYNRDLQEDKQPVFDAADTLIDTLAALRGLMLTITFDRERLREAADSGGGTATDLADALVMKGMPFRTAHELVGAAVLEAQAKDIPLAEAALGVLSEAPGFDPSLLTVLELENSIGARASRGGTAPSRIAEQIGRVETMLDDQERWLAGFGVY